MNKFQHATQLDIPKVEIPKDQTSAKPSRKTFLTVSEVASGEIVEAKPLRIEDVEAIVFNGNPLNTNVLKADVLKADILKASASGDVLAGASQDKGTQDKVEAEDFKAVDFEADDFGPEDFRSEDFGADDFGADDFGPEDFGPEDFDLGGLEDDVFDANEFNLDESNADDFDAALNDAALNDAALNDAALNDDEFDSAEFDNTEFDNTEFDNTEFDSSEFDGSEFEAAESMDAANAADLPNASDDTVDTIGEVMEVEVIDSQEQDRSYEVYQEGSLTYFRYYLDDEEDGGFYDHEGKVSARPFLSAGAMGVGVLAVTFGVGLMMAEATNRRAQSGVQADASLASQQPIGSKRVKTSAKGDPAFPEKLKPDWSSADKAFGKSVTAKGGKDSLLAKSANVEDKVSLAALKLKGDSTQIAAAAAAKSGSPASTWGSSAAATPYIPPAMAIKPIVTPNYQVIASTKLTAAPMPKLTAVPTQSSGVLVSTEQRQLAMRIDAMRKANNGSAAQSAQQALKTSSSLNQAATESVWLPNTSGRTYVTDPIRPAGGPLVTPVEGAYSQQLRNIEVNTDNSVAAVSPAQPSLLDAPPGAVSGDALKRAEVQKQLMNQAIAKPVSGLLVVPVSAPRSGGEALPLDAAPSTSSLQEQVPNTATPDGESLLEAQVPAADVFRVPVIPAPREGGDVQSLQALLARSAGNNALSQGVSASNMALTSTALSPQPLAEGVAQEVMSAADQLDQFRVLSLNAEDYQQLWRMSTSTSDRLLTPAYGFVDYQRSVIAIVKGNATGSGIATTGAPAVERSEVQQLAQALTPAAGELLRN